ncbi:MULTISPECIES: hypothetical protein [unclassified Microcoleus]|uniref:hypothetical protein n=1 Tax=unclassified Microcoleus TaxID=2642155 RepID=UPI002FD34788
MTKQVIICVDDEKTILKSLKIEFVVWTLVRKIERTKVHTTNHFYYGNRSHLISIPKSQI